MEQDLTDLIDTGTPSPSHGGRRLLYGNNSLNGPNGVGLNIDTDNNITNDEFIIDHLTQGKPLNTPDFAEQLSDAQFQQSLDERANELAKDAVSSIPKINFEFTDQNTFKKEIEDWFVYDDNKHLIDIRNDFDKSVTSNWSNASVDEKNMFILRIIDSLETNDSLQQVAGLKNLFYIAAGAYGCTKSVDDQIEQIKQNCQLLWESAILIPLYDNIKLNTSETFNPQKNDSNTINLYYSFTILHFLLQSLSENDDFVDDIDELEPPVLPFFAQYISKLRWQSAGDMPLRNAISIFWKLILSQFGGLERYNKAKTYLHKIHKVKEPLDNQVIASPLDYQAFRQDITAKYPSYVPPQSTVPKWFENTQSISQFIQVPRPGSTVSAAMQLPTPVVHIATPAPSPPSTPLAAPGQKVKRSNFQIDQSYPLIFPGDGEVPFSIKEAGELFASRVYTSLATKQLWDERDKFMKQERGWTNAIENETDIFVESLREGYLTPTTVKYNKERKALNRVDKFYRLTLPCMNSFVVVLLKVIIASVSGTMNATTVDPKNDKSAEYISNRPTSPHFDLNKVDILRAKEITLKTVSAVLYQLSRWLKLSHVLKFEYFSSLLFDCRYFLLVLRYFANQTVSNKALTILDVPKFDFFMVCRELSANSSSDIALDPQMDNHSVLDFDQSKFDQIDNFSWRYMFSSINLLKTLYSCLHNKTQRIIFLAELKPSDTFRKLLSVYQVDLWTSVLPIVKELVPFSGRKWKCNNMDLISAVYLHCKLGLRDDWLVGCDINGELEDAYPQEVALRALVQFYNCRRYTKEMEDLGYKKRENELFPQEFEGWIG